MQENLAAAIELILGYEQGYTDMDRDPGGPTNLGVTRATLAAWRGRPVTPAEVRALQRPEAEDIYRAQYADPVRFAALPNGLDLCVLDCAINSGPSRAAKLLQGLVGVEQDGIIGVHTLQAAARHDTRTLIDEYCDARLAFLRTLATWKDFGRGWTARVRRVLRDAAAMMEGTRLPPNVVTLPTSQAKGEGAVRVTATQSGKAAIAAFASVAGTALVTIADHADQASAALQPYHDVRIVHWFLLGLAVASATGTLVVALRRANAGATT